MPAHYIQSPGNKALAFGNFRGIDFAYKPNQIILAGRDALARLKQILEPGQWRVADTGMEDSMLVVLDDVDVLSLAAKLRAEGHRAEANYALFAQACPHAGQPSGANPNAGQPNPVYANPVYANPVYANPVYANPVYANPVYANPVYANPVYANPVYANPVYANPIYANPVYANPVYANPVYANPVYANPVYANPVYANPVYANPACANPMCAPLCPPPVPVAWICPPPPPCACQPCQCAPCPPPVPGCHAHLGTIEQPGERAGIGRSSAQPAPDPGLRQSIAPRTGPTLVVLDTGLAATQYLPALLADLDGSTLAGDRDLPSEDGDAFLDPFAGHGTFVAGVIEQHAPRMNLQVGRVLNTFGATYQWSLTQKLESLLPDVDANTIINLSLSGFAPEEMMFLGEAIRNVQAKGAVVIAAAGNDASNTPTYPAVLPGVVGVAALDAAGGRASFSNFGPWVRACAPGVDIVSSFFTAFNGPLPAVGGVDPDDFHGWARWSGTSFAAPAVVAALAREMDQTKCTAAQAVATLIDAAGLLSLPGLGTVVNVV